MNINRRVAITTGLGAALSASALSRLRAFEGPLFSAMEGREEFWLTTDAYIYGYPMVSMEITRKMVTNVPKPEGTRGPMGQIIKIGQYPDASSRDVAAPNADTLDITAFFDVSREPWVLNVPDMQGRYYLLPMLDAWTDVFAVPGKRTTGTGRQTYAVTGPGWSGSLPSDVKQLKSPTSLVWLLGRIYCTGTPEDYVAVRALQDQFKLVPLNSYGKPYEPSAGPVDPSIDMKTPVRDQVNKMDAIAYFSLLARLMKANPHAPADAPELAKFKKIGLTAGEDFDSSKLDADFVKRVPQVAFDRIMLQMRVGKAVKNTNNWLFNTETGVYGTDYLNRAFVTAIGLGANRVQDAMCPISIKDADGNDYHGANRYLIRFPKGELPPVGGFWSLTMYDPSYFFIANPLNRYSISPRQNLKTNRDGSIDLYIQNQTPGADKESNWLPAPAGKFILMLRMYWPGEQSPSLINGTWTPPATKKIIFCDDKNSACPPRVATRNRRSRHAGGGVRRHKRSRG